MPIERKLAAIMFTDIAGYTESMSKSESKTLNLLEKKRSILKPLLKEYKGTFVKEIGDGTLSYFESAVNAATCAVKPQETLGLLFCYYYRETLCAAISNRCGGVYTLSDSI